jgi:hypothetical protein
MVVFLCAIPGSVFVLFRYSQYARESALSRCVRWLLDCASYGSPKLAPKTIVSEYQVSSSATFLLPQIVSLLSRKLYWR